MTIGLNQPKAQGGTPRLLLNLILFLLLLTLSASAATQYMAHQLGYPGWSGYLTGTFYQPWAWAGWAWSYWPTHTRVMQTGTFVFCGGAIISLFVYALGVMMTHRQNKGIDTLHGTAHWANRSEIVAAGLLPASPGDEHPGVYVGAWMNKRQTEYLRHNGPEHVLAFAPTRSGKGVGLVLPTLLSWPHSCLVYDIKGENHALTAGWRRSHAGNLILKFDPTADDGSCARFNPLAELRLESNDEVRDAQNIAGLIVDPDGKGMDDHWAKTSYSLLTALILHVAYKKKLEGKGSPTLSDIDAALSDPQKNIMAVLEEMRTYQHKETKPHELVELEARSMLNKPEKELGSVVSTAVSFLSLYRDPIVADNTSESHWAIPDLMNHAKPVSLYLVVRPSDAARLRPLIRLIISMIVNRLTESMQFKDGTSVKGYQHRLLVLLDEFASLKKMEVIEGALAYAAGYGLKFYLIVQDLQQIVKQYSREEGLTGNCHIRIAYAPNKIDTAELLSKMSGTMTVVKESITQSGKRNSWVLGSTSRTYQESQRPLITADEAMRLPAPLKDSSGKITKPGDMLIFAAGYAPVYGTQILYFLDPVFSARSKVPTPKGSDRTIERPKAPHKIETDMQEKELNPPDNDETNDEDEAPLCES